MRTRTAEDWAEIAERIRAEGPISAAAAARQVPASLRRGCGRLRPSHLSASSLVRWIVKGLQGVRLDGARLNGEGWYTSPAALVRFQAELSRRSVVGLEESIETPRQRETRAEAAGRELAELLGEGSR